MTKTQLLEKYVLLITQFVSGIITASQFEVSYLKLFKEEQAELPTHAYDALNNLFLDTDAYCADPDLRDDEDLDEKQLLASAERTLSTLS